MGKMEDLEKILEKEKENKEKNKIDLEKMRDEWVIEVNDLFSNIKTWLNPLFKKGLLRIVADQKSLFEEAVGSYTVPLMEIYFLNHSITIRPIGTFVVGAKGRVDIISYNKTVSIIKLDNGWKIPIKQSYGFDFIDFNEDKFAEIIEDMVK